MSTLSRYVFATAGLVILVGALSVLNPATLQGVVPAKDVNVVNTPDVNVVNIPLPVELATTANVNVVNDEMNPVPVVVQDDDGDSAESREFVILVTTPTPVDLFTVPSGKRLVLTDVTVSSLLGQNAFISRSGVVVSRPFVSTTTYSHTYRTGIQFLEGDTLTVRSGNSTAFFELRGVMTDL